MGDYRILIEGPDGSSLGDPKAVLAQLETYFGEVRYELRPVAPAPHMKPRIISDLWFCLLAWLRNEHSLITGYPQYEGYLFKPDGLFVFLAKSPVMQIAIVSFTDPDHDPSYAKLFAKTGWVGRRRVWQDRFRRF